MNADLLDQCDGRLRRRVHHAEPAHRGDHGHRCPLIRTARQIDEYEPLDPRRLELCAGHGDGCTAGLADDRGWQRFICSGSKAGEVANRIRICGADRREVTSRSIWPA